MASKPLTLAIQPRGNPIPNLPEEVAIDSSDSAAELYKKLAGATGYSVHRLRITKGSDGSAVPPSKEVTVGSTGLRGGSRVMVKDLGPQIDWRTVFVIEYLGPILIHPLVYFSRSLLYSSAALRRSPSPTDLQTLTLALVVGHFLKREAETLLVHRFSLATMPVRNIANNCAHYWLLAGVNLAYWCYAPSAPAAAAATASQGLDLVAYIGVAFFLLGEAMNLRTHLVLRNLRREGSTDRGVPQGWDFDLVTCPNYMWETLAWVGVGLVARSLSMLPYLVVGVGQMAIWAKKKERRYRKEFGAEYKRKRASMIPGLF